jgi:predicted nucleotide-binding protein
VRKTKNFPRTFFAAEVIKEGFVVFSQRIPKESWDDYAYMSLSVRTVDGTWKHDTEEEFFSDYRKGTTHAYYVREVGRKPDKFMLDVTVSGEDTTVEIEAPTRADIEIGFEVFEKYLEASSVPEPKVEAPRPTVFIGHGRSSQWRDLKDHLHDQHGYEVVAYEVGARAGHTIRDILDDMMSTSSFAALVMTGEDEDAEGRLHARPNVIHELGLFQGKLGFSRAVALLEAGTEEFSNIHGIQQIRYGKNNIRETYGEILATLRREFGPSAR